MAQRKTESGFPVKPVYDQSDLPGDIDKRVGPSGRVPVHPRRLPDDVHLAAVDDAPVRRLRHRHRVQRALSPAARARHDGPVGGVRPADPDGLRLRRPGRARRGRQGGRGDRLAGRHADAVRRHPARQGVDLDDDQRARLGAAAALPARRGRGRHPGQRAERHDPERHPQGVHRPGHLHLPAEAVAAAGRRHLRVLPRRGAEVEHHLHLRLPHGRGRRDARAGDRVHAGQRRRLRARGARRRARRRRLRAPAVVLLRRPHHAARGGREVPRRPADLGPADARRVRRAGPEVDDAAVPHPDRRRAAHRAAARGQPGPGGGAGPGRGARRHAVAAHQLATTRRSRCPPRRRPGWRCAPSRCSPTRPT